MPIWLSVAVSLFLLFCAAAWIVWHVRAWRRVQRQQPEGDELDYRRRQFRRRMQTSVMMALLAAAILAGQFLTRPAWLVLLFWVGVLLVVAWVVLLALVDVWATKHYFGRLRQKYFIEEAKLQAELRRIQALRGNGKAKGKRE